MFTLREAQLLLGSLVFVADLAMVAQKLLVHHGPSVGTFLERGNQLAKQMKIHDKYYIFNPNLGDWGEIYVLPS